MKVLLITGTYPPQKCGVGDYTLHLASALAREPNIEVGVLTSYGAEDSSDASRVRLFRTITGWRLINLPQVRRVASEFRPDIVHIQYPSRDFNGKLPNILPIFFKLTGIPVVQTWHEHYRECNQICWLNLLACKTLLYVRPDLPNKLPIWVAKWLCMTHVAYVPNATTIPSQALSTTERLAIKRCLFGDRPVVCYFGFAHPNKGVERLFEIAAPDKHHLVLICDLSENNPYQSRILGISHKAPWAGNVTVTGFLSAKRVGEILAVADAVVFPFPGGAGEWNTSLKAAEAAGTFILATTTNSNKLGYNKQGNIFFADCGDVSGMKAALHQYLGRRIVPKLVDEWRIISTAHTQAYNALL